MLLFSACYFGLMRGDDLRFANVTWGHVNALDATQRHNDTTIPRPQAAGT